MIKKWCGCGTSMPTYDIDGGSYMCQFFSPISIGESKVEETKSIVMKDFFDISLLDEKCRKCPVISICPTCYGSNFIQTSSIFKKSEMECKLNKVMFKARAYFNFRKWEEGLLDSLNDDELQAILRSIKIINELKL